MGLFGRLFGKSKPAAPGTYYVAQDGLIGDPYVIRRVDNEMRAGPSFSSLVEAQKYVDSMEGGPPYRYPPGRV